MASGPITSWQIDGDTVTHYILGPRIPADGDCSHEIKRHFLLWKSCDQPRQHVKMLRHYFANKGPSSQSCGFSSSHVWTWELDYKESWAPGIDTFELWCWRRLLRVPWTSRRSNQSILKAISSEYLVEGLMPKLKVQYFGHLTWRAASFEKTLMLGNIEDGRRRAQQRMRRLDGITNSMDMSLSKLREWVMNRKSGVLQSPGSQSVGHDWVTELNWAFFLGIWMSSSPSTVLGNTVFPPLNDLTTFVKNHLTLCVKVLLRSEFFSIDL